MVDKLAQLSKKVKRKPPMTTRDQSKFLPVHIGLHKAGSTFLQHNIFPLMYPQAPVSQELGVRHPDVLKQFYAGDVDSLVMVSSEKLSGHLQPLYPGMSIERCKNNAEHLAKLNRPVKVLLLIREHMGYLRSAYLQRVKKGFGGSFLDYLGLHSADDLSWSLRIDMLALLSQRLIFNYV
jgi:hypothetical protein